MSLHTATIRFGGNAICARMMIATCLVLLTFGGIATADDAPTRDAAGAAEDLLERLLPERTDDFSFEAIPADEGPADGSHDVFEIEARNGRVVIRGNTGVSMATGLNWYLKHHCDCHVSWYGNQLRLPDPLPAVKARQTAWAKHRYFLNYCCFGYSLPWWDWPQWERLIDWMALNGVNLPLSVTGQEAVWQAVGKRLGMSDAEVREFLAGPPFLPFQWMGCLDGWGGPLPQSWIRRHEALQQKILARQRQLGMTPVLQGFTGHVPAAIGKKFPDAKLHTIHWIEWKTHLLDPLDPLFPKVAGMFMEEQTKRFGTDHYYAADTFIEMTPPSGELDYLRQLSRAIYDGMAASDQRAVWVLQGWAFMYQRSFWTQPRFQAFLDAIDDDRMVLLDLFCESRPMWDQTEAFCGKPWLWCNVQSFGRAVHLGGALPRNNAGLAEARENPERGRLAGLGTVNEGLCYNPVAYDLMFERAWQDGPVDLSAWIAKYAQHRYGRRDEDAVAAWQILREVVYSAPCRTRSIIDHVPNLGAARGAPYDNARLAQAWRHLLDASGELGEVDTYRFDLVNVARQVLSNHAATLHQKVAAAHRAEDREAFRAAVDDFLGLIRDMDELLATREEFLLGCWLEDAKRWGETDAERAQCEFNARRVLTLWGEGPAIDDYARKEWAGMLRGYYLRRWEWYFKELEESLRTGEPFDAKQFGGELRQWMAAWSDRRDVYPTEAHGDSLAVAGRLWAKYGKAFRPNAVSLTTGKPVTCSHALPPYPARLANDGWSNNTDRFWATDVAQNPGPAWWCVDLQKPVPVARVVVVGYYGDGRHYGFTVETSLDGEAWDKAADRPENSELSTAEGYLCKFDPRPVRFIRITQTHNSANSGRHLVEVMAFGQ